MLWLLGLWQCVQHLVLEASCWCGKVRLWVYNLPKTVLSCQCGTDFRSLDADGTAGVNVAQGTWALHTALEGGSSGDQTQPDHCQAPPHIKGRRGGDTKGLPGGLHRPRGWGFAWILETQNGNFKVPTYSHYGVGVYQHGVATKLCPREWGILWVLETQISSSQI